ncbi:GFA family protein [Neorhizobium tomejilense]|uniref:GFA family protein n=1 Tax=Neorhizobium tomejilense TaxID=2093828 RepID=UPI000CF906FB|nr:GFA family protein [Neorhizobium tomejilense]
MEQKNSGRCLCGAIRFETVGPLRTVTACHCSQCRRQTGLYYAATSVRVENMTLEGEEVLSWYRASDEARRGFCSQCGSALFWQAEGAASISILAGAFDQPSGLVMGEHIYCADKGDFYQLPEDGVPHYPGDRPASA